MIEAKSTPSIPPEELHGAVQMITGEKLVALRDRFRGEQFDPNLLITSHDSQAGGAVRYGGVLLFLEADSPDFNIIEVTKKLLGLA